MRWWPKGRQSGGKSGENGDLWKSANNKNKVKKCVMQTISIFFYLKHLFIFSCPPFVQEAFIEIILYTWHNIKTGLHYWKAKILIQKWYTNKANVTWFLNKSPYQRAQDCGGFLELANLNCKSLFYKSDFLQVTSSFLTFPHGSSSAIYHLFYYIHICFKKADVFNTIIG